jgi:hypothetical protein
MTINGGLHKSNPKYGEEGVPASIPRKEPGRPLNGRLGVAQSRFESICGREKFRVLLEFEPRNVHPIFLREVNETLLVDATCFHSI